MEEESDDVKNVLIIGGTTRGGIGEGLAKYIDKHYQGMTVACPTPDKVDVRYSKSIETYISQTEPWDAVLYSAGVNFIGPLDSIPEHQLHEIYNVNVMGYVRLLAAVTRYQQGGRVCAVTGISSRMPMRYTVPYCSSKAALSHAIRCSAKELGPPWQITGIAPATVESTEMSISTDLQIMGLREWDYNELFRREKVKQPYGRRVTTEEVAKTIMMIFNGPGYLTGSIIDIAGGA